MAGDELIASGRSADVYSAGAGRVKVRYREPRNVRRQASLMELAIAAGYPVPRIFEVGPQEILMERIEGPTMFQDLVGHPERAEQHAATLADLHQRLHQLGIIHRDLHPMNVVLSAGTPTVIDWESAELGDAAIDLAETWVLLATSDTAAGHRLIGERFLPAFLALIDRESARAALDAVIAKRKVDPHMSRLELLRMKALLRTA